MIEELEDGVVAKIWENEMQNGQLAINEWECMNLREIFKELNLIEDGDLDKDKISSPIYRDYLQKRIDVRINEIEEGNDG